MYLRSDISRLSLSHKSFFNCVFSRTLFIVLISLKYDVSVSFDILQRTHKILSVVEEIEILCVSQHATAGVFLLKMRAHNLPESYNRE